MIILIVNLYFIIAVFQPGGSSGKDPVGLLLGAYSCWGINSAFLSQLFSALACHYEGWFKLAYIASEISLSINIVVVILFWIAGGNYKLLAGPHHTMDFRTQMIQILCHMTPMLANISDLASTDMALEKTHWWICTITFCPFYMCFNWYFSFVIGEFANPGRMGSIYSMEQWDKSVPLTMLLFVFGGFCQGGLFYCTSAIMEKIWPKRPEEEFEFEKAAVSLSQKIEV